MDTIKFEKGNVLMVAHRGLSGIETENTNAAFIAAGNRSYYGIETDIKRTADGKFVLNHDGHLQRIAGENVAVAEVSLALLQNVLLLDTDGTRDRQDLRPATLENYIKLCKRYEKQCVLELKDEFTEAELTQIIDVIKSYDYLDHVTFISFLYENMKMVRKLLPEQAAQFLSRVLTDEIIAEAAADRIDVDIDYRGLTTENIAAAHAAGLKVNCWTINTKELGEQMVAWGVDYITTNILE